MALIGWGRSTASTAPLVGGTRSFSKPGSLTMRVASGGTCSSLNAPSASVRTSMPRTTTEAPASGFRSASSTRPLTVGEGHGNSGAGSGLTTLGSGTGGRASGRARGGSGVGGGVASAIATGGSTSLASVQPVWARRDRGHRSRRRHGRRGHDGTNRGNLWHRSGA